MDVGQKRADQLFVVPYIVRIDRIRIDIVEVGLTSLWQQHHCQAEQGERKVF
ncbi:hypothetical protein D3C87_1847910 [compost metagenome]